MTRALLSARWPSDTAVTGACDQAAATDGAAPASPSSTPGLREVQALLLPYAARARQTALPDLPSAEETGNARLEIRGNGPRRFSGLLRQMRKIPRSYRDPRFERADLVEDDYSRLRNYPRG